jgi:ankyrin repeat protein
MSVESFLNAIHKSNINALGKLIENGENINRYTPDGYTILMTAINNNKYDIVDYLLKSGANPNFSNMYGATPLMFSTAIIKPKFVELLLENGADTNITNNFGSTALITAIRNESLDIVRMLLKAGANPSIENKKKESPILLATLYHNLPIIEQLLAYGAVEPQNTLSYRTIDNYYLYVQLLGELNKESKFILQQYTRHGDRIINALLQGTDTIQTYSSNIFNSYMYPMRENVEQEKFFCLILGELAPDAVKLFYANDTKAFYKIYADTIYPQIRSKLAENDLAFFRNMTYNVIQKFYKTIIDTKKNETVFKTYRGSRDFYLNTDATAIFKLSTFHSTSISKTVAEGFGDKIYIFNVHPECVYMYMEPLTLFPGEYELLLAPGNRYAFIKEEGNTQTYAVLPPEKDYELPDTYSDYLEYLRSSLPKHLMKEENMSRLNRSSAMAGGYKQTRKQRRRQRGTRRTKLRKQRGAGNEGSSENRWTEEVPIIDIEKRNTNDRKMIQTMLRELA